MARVPRITGAFHGAMPSTTPAGWRIAIDRMPGLSDGITSPVICVVKAAASRRIPAARWTLKPAHGAVAPVSSSINLTKSAVLLSIRSAAFSKSARRALAGHRVLAIEYRSPLGFHRRAIDNECDIHVGSSYRLLVHRCVRPPAIPASRPGWLRYPAGILRRRSFHDP